MQDLPALRDHMFPEILVIAVLQAFVTSALLPAESRWRISMPPALVISFRVAFPPISQREHTAKASSICTGGHDTSETVLIAASSESIPPASTNASRVPPPPSAQLNL